jgi:RNA polymerase sigma-70 factor, ECF subfamily
VSDDQPNYWGNAGEENAPSKVQQLTLISRAQSGDTHAFSALIEPQRHRIYRMAAQITCNHEDAEDACQTGLMKAFVHMRSFQGTAQFSTWLTRIVMNEALMIIRRMQAESQYRVNGSDLFDTPFLLQVADRTTFADPEVVCARNEQISLLWEAINQLGWRSRLAVCQMGLGEGKTEDVATQSRISRSGVRSRLQRAKRDLRAILADKLKCRKGQIQGLA